MKLSGELAAPPAAAIHLRTPERPPQPRPQQDDAERRRLLELERADIIQRRLRYLRYLDLSGIEPNDKKTEN